MTNENVETKAVTWDAIGKALADKVRSATDARTFVPAYVWQVVAAALPSIDEEVARARGRGKVKATYDSLAEKLSEASGMELTGESVRQYRSRIKSGKFDQRLAEIGFRRIGNRIEPLQTFLGAGPVNLVSNGPTTVANQQPAKPNLPAPVTGAPTSDLNTSIRVRPDPE